MVSRSSNSPAGSPLRNYHLIAHSGIQGAGVAVVTGDIWLSLSEWFAHTVINGLKMRGKTRRFVVHILQKHGSAPILFPTGEYRFIMSWAVP
jgi:hypothetical protein